MDVSATLARNPPASRNGRVRGTARGTVLEAEQTRALARQFHVEARLDTRHSATGVVAAVVEVRIRPATPGGCYVCCPASNAIPPPPIAGHLREVCLCSTKQDFGSSNSGTSFVACMSIEAVSSHHTKPMCDDGTTKKGFDCILTT